MQSDYVKSSYESFVAEATKLGELYADLAAKLTSRSRANSVRLPRRSDVVTRGELTSPAAPAGLFRI